MNNFITGKYLQQNILIFNDLQQNRNYRIDFFARQLMNFHFTQQITAYG